jgi:hypothetical protein
MVGPFRKCESNLLLSYEPGNVINSEGTQEGPQGTLGMPVLVVQARCQKAARQRARNSLRSFDLGLIGEAECPS